jgi:hypothetical protein
MEDRGDSFRTALPLPDDNRTSPHTRRKPSNGSSVLARLSSWKISYQSASHVANASYLFAAGVFRLCGLRYDREGEGKKSSNRKASKHWTHLHLARGPLQLGRLVVIEKHQTLGMI